MTTRIWKVVYGNWTSIKIVAPNVKAAINEARKLRKGQYNNRIQDITEVILVAEAQ